MSTISGISGSGNAMAAASSQRNQHHAKMFAKVDSDGSGGVDSAELGKMLSDISQRSGVSAGDTQELFAKMDGNADGALSSDELGQGMKDLMPPPPSTMAFAQARGSEGAEGPQGGPPPSGPPPPGGPGGAGSASAADETASGSSSTSYDALDTNKDGEVSDLERLAGALKNLAENEKSESSSGSFSSEIAKLAQNLYEKISGSNLSYSSSSQVSVAA